MAEPADVDGEEAPAPFELYALRYAVHGGRAPADNFLHADPHDAGSDLAYFIWLARRDAEIYVIDTGFAADAAAARGRTLLRTPSEALRLLGVDAAQVEQVILTHLHYDHAGTLTEFPRACFHLQAAEPAYATGPCICRPEARAVFDVENIVDYVRALYAGRVTFHDGDRRLAPGLWLHSVPGHSAGLQCVRVFTRRGWVVVASDATHLYANLARRNPFPIFVDEQALLRGFERLVALAPSLDHIVPGHDPAVIRAYPAPHPSLEGIAVRLDEPPLLSWQELAR
ncbi:N-acyl homoserine lactonase family protein [Mesorhizobium sp. ZMM04-5]|uniref:N-acyl homoserine lactonase family protein n=1 Tax=Mesorhizobium marinum TaxID=3228790 RepID=A0ABV3R1F3_9HYPH